MRLKISHKTIYTYDKPVHYALLQLRLTPRNAVGQRVISWESHLTGGDRQVTFDDQFRNRVDLIMMQDTDRLEIHSVGEVEVEDRAGVVGPGEAMTPLWLFLRKTAMTTPGSHVRKLARQVESAFTENQLSGAHALAEAVAAAVEYRTGTTTAMTTAEESIASGQGVCQDHAHIMIAAARHLGIPARYVSGYLMMDEVPEQEAGHAWAELMIDGLGWVGFDVSNAVCPDDRYVRVAVGRDYADAAPVHGLRQGDASEELCVSLQVQQ